MNVRPTLRIAAPIALVLAGACSSPPTGPDDLPALRMTEEDGVVLLTQNVVHSATMAALYEGDVTVDGEGCLRLASPDAHTVVWPLGYGVRAEGLEKVVHDEEGAAVGTVGGAFSLPGGEVTELSDAMGFTAQDRALADSRCPGRYWIVG